MSSQPSASVSHAVRSLSAACGSAAAAIAAKTAKQISYGEQRQIDLILAMSARSDGVTGRRIIAKEWDAERLNREPADNVGSPAGW
jgi:hypothetical protein